MEDLFALSGSRLADKYEVQRCVAEGGFGVVYQAQHLTLQKTVAVKVLKVPATLSPGARAAFVEAFCREARTVARLEHPAVVRVLDFGASETPSGVFAPWMVMEWLSGETLDAYLDGRAGGHTPAQCLALLRPMFEALAAAHEEGIAHRDIKPANIMLLRPRADTGRRTGGRSGAASVRLMDFGIAKVMQPEERATSGMTRTHAAFLTFSLPYASPEQLSGTRTGPWTDVHALGLILTQMLTGRAPYPCHDPMELNMAVLSPYRPTPARFGVDVGSWEPVLQRALSLRPADRFAHAGELLDALESSVPVAVDAPLPRASSRRPRVARWVAAGVAMACCAALSAAALHRPWRTQHAPAVVAAVRATVPAPTPVTDVPTPREPAPSPVSPTPVMAVAPPPAPPSPEQPRPRAVSLGARRASRRVGAPPMSTAAPLPPPAMVAPVVAPPTVERIAVE